MLRVAAPILAALLFFSGCTAKADDASPADAGASPAKPLPTLPVVGGRVAKLQWLSLPELRVGLPGKAERTDIQRRVSDTVVLDSYEVGGAGVSLFRGTPDTRWNLNAELRNRAQYLHGSLDHVSAGKVAGRPALTGRLVYVRTDNDTTETMNLTAVDCGPLMAVVFFKFAGTQGEINPALATISSTLAFTNDCSTPAA